MPIGSRVEVHPIQVVVRRSGVSADLLRAWERRYGAVAPSRSEGGHRLYSDADIERLRLIKEAMLGGRRISDVAALPTAEIARLVSRDAAERPPDGPDAGASEAANTFLAQALTAVRQADQVALRAILSRALFARTPDRFALEIATPLMRALGELWARGELTPAHEHAASEVVRRLLQEMLDMLHPADGAPRLVVATLAGQRHDLGALSAAIAAALDGWRVTYLGSDLPAADIAQVAADVGAAAVALSITTPGASLPADLTTLRKRLGRSTPVLVGGQQAEAVARSVRQVDVVRDVDSFREALREIASAGAGDPANRAARAAAR